MVLVGRGGAVVGIGEARLCETLSRIQLQHEEQVEEEDEYDRQGWGYWDARARLELFEEYLEGKEKEGRCNWTNIKGESVWVNHADECPAIVEEIKVALKSSLERKVASLEADRWMFEGDSGRKI